MSLSTLTKPDPEPQPLPAVVARRIQELRKFKDPQADSYAKAIAQEWGVA
jgi:hypothetical protein